MQRDASLSERCFVFSRPAYEVCCSIKADKLVGFSVYYYFKYFNRFIEDAMHAKVRFPDLVEINGFLFDLELTETVPNQSRLSDLSFYQTTTDVIRFCVCLAVSSVRGLFSVWFQNELKIVNSVILIS